jgi:hypothetical protein
MIKASTDKGYKDFILMNDLVGMVKLYVYPVYIESNFTWKRFGNAMRCFLTNTLINHGPETRTGTQDFLITRCHWYFLWHQDRVNSE